MKANTVQIWIDGQAAAERVALAADPLARGRGLAGRRVLDPAEGLLMVLPATQRGHSGLWVSIHMLGVPFALAVAWLDERGQVVHAVLARPGRPYYTTPRPAWYTLELHPQHLDRLAVGAQVSWKGQG